MPNVCQQEDEEEVMVEKKPPKVKRTEFRSCNGCGTLTASSICPDCNKPIK